MIRVAMVCMGNICRSPIAEQVLRYKAEAAGLDLQVASAGTGGWHVGDPADHRASEVLRSHGYGSGHRAQQFKTDWFERFDHILVMDRDNLRNVSRLATSDDHRAKIRLLRDFDATAGAGAEVPDPYYGVAADFAETLRLVELACDGFIEHLRRS